MANETVPAEDDFVIAVHKETKLIQSVPVAWLDIFPQLTKASQKVIKSAQEGPVVEADAAAVQEGTK